jgi:hypothetical protein
MRLLTKIGCAAAVALAAFLAVPHAQAQVSLSLYPVSFRYDIPRGSSQTGVITVSNPSEVPLTLSVETENFTGGDGGTVEYAPEGAKYGLLSWITIDKTPFTLGPGQKKEVSFTVDVPDNAEVGGHYGTVLFRAQPTTAGGGGSEIGISGRVGSIILVSVPGNVKKSGEFTKMAAPGFVQYGPLTVNATYKNTGSVHYVTKGNVTFTGIFGKKTIPFEEKTILPDVTREDITATLDKTWLIGPVFMKATLEAGDGSVATMSATSFAFPILPGGAVILVIALIIFGMRYIKKRFKIVRAE